MNPKFSEATTSIGFALQLSKRQCHSLLCLVDPAFTERDRLYLLGVDGLNGLHRKGLVFWHIKDDRPCGFGGLTEAGRLVAKLLQEAGLSAEACVTPLTAKRMDWESERAARARDKEPT